MTRLHTTLLAMAALAGAALFVYAQAPVRKNANLNHPYWETKALLPREITPAHYVQVPLRDVEAMAADGWELVAATPFVMLNEARGERRDTVTQVYPAYYFKRMRNER